MTKTLKDGREKIIKSLKLHAVPEIRNQGFLGSFPHFRREKNGIFEFLSFQFNKYGGSFVIEYAKTRKVELPTFAQALAFNELNYGYTHPKNRIRIKPDGIKDADFWFTYSDFVEEAQFEDLAKSVRLLLSKVESFLK